MTETRISKDEDGLFQAVVTIDGRTRTFSPFDTYEAAQEMADRAEQMRFSEQLNRWVTIPA